MLFHNYVVLWFVFTQVSRTGSLSVLGQELVEVYQLDIESFYKAEEADEIACEHAKATHLDNNESLFEIKL